MNNDNSKLLEEVGNLIRIERIKIGYSQEKLALEANLDRTYISAIERGRKNLTITSLSKISTSLNIKLSDLLRNLSY